MIRSTRNSRRRGATVVEFAVVAGVLLPLIFAMLEYCRYVMVRQLMENAAREGARFAVVHTNDKTTDDVIQQVEAVMAGQQQNLTNWSIQVYRTDASGANLGDWTDAAFGEAIAVQINGEFHPVAVWINATIPVQVRAVMYSEAN